MAQGTEDDKGSPPYPGISEFLVFHRAPADEASFNIPNSQLAKATIINLYYPTPVHAMRVKVGIEYRTAPNEVKEALVKAASSVRGVLSEPAPQAFLVAFGNSSIDYELKFWLRDGRRYPQIVDGIRTNCWYEFARRGISFAYPVRIIEQREPQTLDHDRKAEIHKPAVAVLLHEHPHLAEQLSETLAARRLATKSELERFDSEAAETRAVRTKENVLARLRLFFEL